MAQIKIMERYVVFGLNELRIALPLSAVERVVAAVYINPLPDAPAIVLGVINVQGRVMPVVNMRHRFRLEDRRMVLADRLIIAHTARRPVALVVDEVHGVFEYPAPALVDGAEILAGLDYVEGVVKRADGLVLIHNLERFLSLTEEEALTRAMTTAADR